MGKLNQIIAVEKGIKSRVHSELSELHKALQKPDLFNGFAKEYRRKDEDGETLPPERKRVQFVVSEALRGVERSSIELYDITARKDWTNCLAKGSITVDGQTLLADVPVSFLLFLEKQLTDLRTMVAALPILDEGENWNKDENSGLYKTEATQTHRTKKVSKPIVLYPATPEHPAQTQMVTEDVIAGFWHTVKHSGAMAKPDKQALADRVEKLLRAVKEAREAANIFEEVESPKVGEAIFGYLLGD
jgi:hypothetical protein